jgi:hypothetical protein
VLTPFQLSPVLAPLERHAPHRTAHASLIAGIRSLLAGTGLAPQPSLPGPLTEPLSGSEVRLLRYLPTNLSLPEIARELSVSPTLSSPTSGAYTPSPAPTAAPAPWRRPAPSACSHPSARGSGRPTRTALNLPLACSASGTTTTGTGQRRTTVEVIAAAATGSSRKRPARGQPVPGGLARYPARVALTRGLVRWRHQPVPTSGPRRTGPGA